MPAPITDDGTGNADTSATSDASTFNGVQLGDEIRTHTHDDGYARQESHNRRRVGDDRGGGSVP